MRKDMAKVIVERERRGTYKEGKHFREEQRAKVDPEAAPTKEPMRAKRERTKELNENLNPLKKFLMKSVGRPWNKVKAEIHEHIRPTSTVQNHVLQHLDNYVEEHPVMKGKIPYRIGYQGLTPLTNGRFSRKELYV